MTLRTLQREGVTRELKPADSAGIRSAIDAYTTSWLTNDPEAVTRTLTQDAVLIPHHGVPPVEGAAAIRTFWWPEGGSPTTITAFTMTTDEIGGSCDLGFARGRFALSFTYDEADQLKSASNTGNYLSLLRRQSDGTWRISHQMWGDPI